MTIKSRKSRSIKTLRVLLVASTASTPALAVDAGDSELIVVTGNRGRERTVLDSPAPIDVLASQDLERLGANTSLRDALTQLLPSFSQLTLASSAWGSLARPAGLRGLGGSQVLVLVDGKRRHASSLLTFSSGSVDSGASPVDFDLIPASAIERIEVLRDGAAAQYGSDAIAGVINIILKNKPSGGLLSVNAGQRYAYRGKSDGRNVEASANIGLPVGGGFLSLSASLRDNNHARRSVPSTGAFYFPIAPGVPDPREDRDKTVYAGGLPDIRLATLWYNSEIPVGDTLSFYSWGSYSHRKAIVGQSFRRPNSDSTILSIYPDGYAPNYTLKENDAQILAGLKGNIAGWKWDISGTYGTNKSRNGSTNSLNPSFGEQSPTEFHTFTGKFEQAVFNLDVSKSFEIGADSTLDVSAGAEYRWEHYRTRAGDPEAYLSGGYIYPSGPLAGRAAMVGAQGAIVVSPSDEASLRRHNYAAYVDLGLDLSKRWFIGLAGRAEDYSDASGSTVTGKVSTRYQIADGINLRATFSNGFRAPSLSQIGFGRSSNGVRLINGVFTLVPTKLVQPESTIGIALGAKPLTPEKSTNISAGFAARITDSLNLSADIYQIKLKDRIVQTGLLSGAAIEAILVANGFDPRQSVRYFANAIDTRTRGVEVVASYNKSWADSWSLDLSAAFSYIKTKITKIAPSPDELSDVNLNLFSRQEQGYIENFAPKTKLVLGQTIGHGPLSLNLRESWYGKTKRLDASAAADQTFGAKWVVDIDLSYRLLENLTLAVGANNVFDTYPDKVNAVNPNGNPPWTDSSPFGFFGGYYYARASFSF